MCPQYNVDPKNIKQIEDAIQKQLLINQKVREIEEKADAIIEKAEKILDFKDDFDLVMLSKSDIIDALESVIAAYKIRNDNTQARKYEVLYKEYTTTSIYEDKAEEVLDALGSLIGAEEVELIIRSNLRDAYLGRGDIQNANIQIALIKDLSKRLDGQVDE